MTNQLIINGRLTSDPVPSVANGKDLIRLSICHNLWTGKESKPMYLEITFWEKQAEAVAKAELGKGDEIIVSGQLYPDEYNGKPKLTIKFASFVCKVARSEK